MSLLIVSTGLTLKTMNYEIKIRAFMECLPPKKYECQNNSIF